MGLKCDFRNSHLELLDTEAVVLQDWLLKIFAISQENTFVEVSF